MINNKIYMSNGSSKSISLLSIKDEIKGYDYINDKIIDTTILSKNNLGKNINYKIIIKKERAGSGSSTQTLFLSENQEIYSNSEKIFKPIKLFSTSDTVLSIRYDYGLNPIQKQILLGKMLGDGSLCVHSEISAYIRWSHSEKQKDYFDYTNTSLGSIWSGVVDNATSGYGSLMYRSKTVSTNLIKDNFQDFIVEKKKAIPEWVCNVINPIGLAFWYMDDGSLLHNDNQVDRAAFHTCLFSDKDLNILVQSLLKFNIKSSIEFPMKSGKDTLYPTITLSADNAETLFLLIAPYITKSMQYKLPKRYRGHSHYIPPQDEFKPPLVEQKIISIENIGNIHNISLDTLSGNYFAQTILIK